MIYKNKVKNKNQKERKPNEKLVKKEGEKNHEKLFIKNKRGIKKKNTPMERKIMQNDLLIERRRKTKTKKRENPMKN
jgi:hypothetical protein